MSRVQPLFDRLAGMSDSEFATIASGEDGEQLLACMVGALGDALDAYSAYRAALEEVIDPLRFMRERAEAEGNRLDGMMAYTIANSTSHLRSIARAALRDNGSDRNGENGRSPVECVASQSGSPSGEIAQTTTEVAP